MSAVGVQLALAGRERGWTLASVGDRDDGLVLILSTPTGLRDVFVPIALDALGGVAVGQPTEIVPPEPEAAEEPRR